MKKKPVCEEDLVKGGEDDEKVTRASSRRPIGCVTRFVFKAKSNKNH